MATPPAHYFHLPLHLSGHARTTLQLDQILLPLLGRRYPSIVICRRLAAALQQREDRSAAAVSAAYLHLYGTLLEVYRYVIDRLAEDDATGRLAAAAERAGLDRRVPPLTTAITGFLKHFPPAGELADHPEAVREQLVLREMLLLRLATENKAVEPFRFLFDDRLLVGDTPAYVQVVNAIGTALAAGPPVPGLDMTLMEVLRAPLRAAPDSLVGQLGYIRDAWGSLLPRELFEGVLTAFDILDEEQVARGMGGPGPSHVLEFGPGGGVARRLAPGDTAGYEQPEYEAFSPDADWMSTVVLMAKMTHVWLYQLTQWYGYPINRLDQVPDRELDQLAAWGFTGLWLIGLWERSPASRRIKELCGNPEAHASAYSLYDYTIAADLGGEAAFNNLKQRAWQRGIRLASDMVPNHTGIYSRWVVEHPDWFIQCEYPPFPTYRFNGEDLSSDPAVTIQIEDGYWSKDDAAVVFRMIDRRDGRTRYLYHGNDGTSIPWNDTAQLNYLLPEVREAVMQTILHVARLTPIIRFDAAMTLAKKHYQRLWFPQRGLGGGIPSRAEYAMSRDEFDAVFPTEFWREVVDRVAREVPDTLLLAEAFWLMEGYFVRTLGMHRVYNSAFMNMLKAEENAKYRQTLKNVLEFNPEILKRFVNFMNNPDEKTAVEQFGSQGKYFGACVLLATMPGLPMFGHGQIEGFREKYGMEYRRSYWDEEIDQGLLEGHRMWIFPLLKKRWLFSGSEHFCLYDFRCHDGSVDENVFAYSNQAGSERALVVYNNRHGRTAGWVRDTTAVAVKEADGTTSLRHTTLGAAMGLTDAQDMFLAFRDLASGLEYLRNCRELHEQGMYVELGEYEFHLFWQCHELQDSPDDCGCGWAALCRELAGRGVPSLAEALIQLRHRALIAACDAICNLVAEQIDGVPPAVGALEAAYADYQAALPAGEPAEQFGRSLTALREVLQAVFSYRIAARTVRLVRNAGVQRRDLPSKKGERRAFVASLLAGYLAMPLGADAVTTYGLQWPLTAFIAGFDTYGREWGLYQAERCAASALAWQVWSDPHLDSPSERLAALFGVPELQRFVYVHEDGGVTWFNKERFEELARWLALRSCFEQARGAAAVPVPVAELCLLAAAAGYRLRRFTNLVEESTAPR